MMYVFSLIALIIAAIIVVSRKNKLTKIMGVIATCIIVALSLIYVGNDVQFVNKQDELKITGESQSGYASGVVSAKLQVRNTKNPIEDADWYASVVADEGDILRFKITYRNESNNIQKDVCVFVKWSTGIEYIPGTTKLYNSNHKKGVDLESDGIGTDEGINIGNYLSNAAAVVTFEARVKEGFSPGFNYLRQWVQIYVNDLSPELIKGWAQNYADVLLLKEREK